MVLSGGKEAVQRQKRGNRALRDGEQWSETAESLLSS